MNQRQHPAEQQRHSQYDEQVARIYPGRIRRKENGKEGDDGYQSGSQQRNGCLTADSRHGFHARFSRLQVHQNAVDDDDGIVHQHTHGQDEGTQRHPLHGASCRLQEEERTKHRDYQADADDKPALESHG